MMPKVLHEKLAKGAKKAGLSGSRAAAYIHGTMAKIEALKKKKAAR